MTQRNCHRNTSTAEQPQTRRQAFEQSLPYRHIPNGNSGEIHGRNLGFISGKQILTMPFIQHIKLCGSDILNSDNGMFRFGWTKSSIVWFV